MSTAEKMRRYTIEEYLALERKAEIRSEYVDGCLFAMAGESPEHADISANILGSLVPQLRGKPCRARTKDTKVISGPTLRYKNQTKGMFSYPDIVVLCDEPEYFDDARDIVTNPTLIVEVLSPSTEAFDRGGKFQRYSLWNPTLKEYLLVSQDQPFVSHFVRQKEGSWNYRPYSDLTVEFQLPSIDCALKLSEIYDRVKFPDADPLLP